jgi:hypothetical protein
MTARAYFNLNSALRMRSLKRRGQGTSNEANNGSNAMVWLTKLQSPAERTLVKEVLYLPGNLVTKSRDSFDRLFLVEIASGSFKESERFMNSFSRIKKIASGCITGTDHYKNPHECGAGTIFFRSDHPTSPSWELSFALFIISYSRCT